MNLQSRIGSVGAFFSCLAMHFFLGIHTLEAHYCQCYTFLSQIIAIQIFYIQTFQSGQV